MSTPLFSTKRARIAIQAIGSTEVLELENLNAATVSLNEETLSVQSTSEVVGTIAKIPLSLDGDLSLELDNTSFEMFAEFTRAKVSVQASGTVAVTLPAGAAGTGFKLPKENVLDCTFPGLTEGVDFRYYGVSGIVIRMRDITADVAGGSITFGPTRRAGIGTKAQREYIVHVTDIKDGRYYGLYRASFNMLTNIELVKPNELGRFPVTAQLLADPSKPYDDALGQLGFMAEVVAED